MLFDKKKPGRKPKKKADDGSSSEESGSDSSDSEDEDALSKSLLAHCQEHLASYKIPKEFRFLPTLPKTTNGKVRRRTLKDTYSPFKY